LFFKGEQVIRIGLALVSLIGGRMKL